MAQVLKKPLSPDQAREAYDTTLIEVFSELADLFGNPRSHGQIYGLLFASVEALTMEEIVERLGISKGSASMGLRALEELGAIERQSAGEGRGQGTYSAKLELRILIQGFIEKRLLPRLEQSNEKISSLEEVVRALPQEDIKDAKLKVQRVKQWHDRASTLLPVAEKILQATGKFI